MFKVNQKVRVILDEDFEVTGTVVKEFEDSVELNLYPNYNWIIPLGYPFFIEPYENYYNTDEYVNGDY